MKRSLVSYGLPSFSLLLSLSTACGVPTESEEELQLAEVQAATTCSPSLRYYPVRGRHNNGYDSSAGNSSLWTCNAEYSNSDYNSSHLGNDIWAAEGTPVVATVNGTFRFVEANNTYSGNKLTIVDDCGWYHFYAHLQKFGPGISASLNGTRVQAGRVVGYVGKTGSSSNGVVHLHYSIYPDNNYNAAINPGSHLRAVEQNVCTLPGDPSTSFKGGWHLRDANSAGTPSIPAFTMGAAGDIPVVGDWNGDGRKTVGIYRPTTNLWHLRNSNTAGSADIAAFSFGNADDIQLAGDWNGDGTDTIGVYRPSTSTWYLRNTNSGGAHDVTFTFGSPNDVPVVGDWNGDGRDTIGVYRPSTNLFYLRNTLAGGNADLSFSFGGPDDMQVAGDWNGDGIDTIGVFRKGAWFLRNSNSAGPHDVTFTYGAATNMPVTGDWNGDGTDTVGVAQ